MKPACAGNGPKSKCQEFVFNDKKVDFGMVHGMIWLNIELFSGRTFGFDEKCSSTLILNLLEIGILNDSQSETVFKNKYILPIKDEFNYGFIDIELSLKGEATPKVAGFFSRAVLELENLQPAAKVQKEKQKVKVPKKYRENA